MSLRHNHRVRVKVACNENDFIPSAASVFSAASWFERRPTIYLVFCFRTIRICGGYLQTMGLMDTRCVKIFPSVGIFKYGTTRQKKRVVREPVKLTQAFRSFDFLSPWEGADYIFPGDEKADADRE